LRDVRLGPYPGARTRNVELTGEIADGWLVNAFIPEHVEVFLDPIRTGWARAGRTIDQLDLVMPVAVEFTDDPEEAGRRHAGGYAFTIGAMGAPGKNFYNGAFSAQCCGDDVAAVYELWQAGKREEAGPACRSTSGSRRTCSAVRGDSRACAPLPRRWHHDAASRGDRSTTTRHGGATRRSRARDGRRTARRLIVPVTDEHRMRPSSDGSVDFASVVDARLLASR
jgi:alkanesulfonate monooxygenase SsuD/methylene tetrahydromethanopterin reductase-like flavin-dependent oxidoreductase (luciferase family)